MGNRITNELAGDYVGLKMSNGGTDAFISVLLLAGSRAAKSSWEKDFVAWIAEKDSEFRGSGVIGFDLSEIAWTKQDFDKQKEFVLATIDKALVRHRWSALNYDPPVVSGYLKKLRSMVEQYQQEFVREEKNWCFFAKLSDTTFCPAHDVVAHEHGCQICNNKPYDDDTRRLTHLNIGNYGKSGTKKILFEPWGHPVEIQPGESIQIVATGPMSNCLELIPEDPNAPNNGLDIHLSVYAWQPVSSIAVYKSGELIEAFGAPLPDQPIGKLFKKLKTFSASAT